MKNFSKVFSFATSVFILASLLLLTGNVTPLQAQDVVVSAAIPDNAPQGTVNLNVHIKGNGFKKGAVAKWYVNGTTDPGGVTVNSTTYASSTDLIANINVASGAQTQKKFDIQVTLTSGRTGKGIELFSVIYNPPDPAIAFVALYQKRMDLVVMNADGSNQMTIVSQQLVENDYPAWSPDGTQLAFSRFDRKANQSAIYVVNKDGSGLRKVINCNSTASYKISWSPVPLGDGNYKIAFSDRARLPGGTLAPQSDIFIVNLDGSGLTQLTNTQDVKEWEVCWSPMADRIAVRAYNYVINNGVGNLPVYAVSYDAATGFTAKVLIDLMAVPGSPLKGDFSDAAWANTQDKIAVSAPLTPGAGYYKIWVIDLEDAANPVDLTPTPNTFSWRPSWSPEDSQIVYLSSGDGVWVINSADGSGATQIAAPTNTFSYWSLDWRRCCPMCAIQCAP
jgi:hypothetical protein